MTRYADFFESTAPIQPQEFTPTPEHRHWQLTAPLHDVIDAYFERQPLDYQKFIAELGAQILQQETGWKSITAIDQLYTAPAAAHHEMCYVRPALNAYTNLEDGTPYAVVVSSNWPPDGNKGDIAQTNKEINAFQLERPDITVGHFGLEYPERTPMGRIVRNNSDVGLYLIRELGITPATGNDIMKTFHAVDMEYLSPNYAAARQAAYKRTSADSGGGIWLPSNCRHSPSENNQLLHIDEFISWWDFVVNLKGGYELGMSTDIRTYTAVNGLNEAKVNGELEDLRNRSLEWFGKTWDPNRYTSSGDVILTSGRRMYHNVQAPDALGDVMWERDGFIEEGGGYRKMQPNNDITPERRDMLIADLIGADSEVILRLLKKQAQRELGLADKQATDHSIGLINQKLREQGCKIQAFATDNGLRIAAVDSSEG